MTNVMVKVFLLMQMEANTKVNSKMTNVMVKVFTVV